MLKIKENFLSNISDIYESYLMNFVLSK